MMATRLPLPPRPPARAGTRAPSREASLRAPCRPGCARARGHLRRRRRARRRSPLRRARAPRSSSARGRHEQDGCAAAGRFARSGSCAARVRPRAPARGAHRRSPCPPATAPGGGATTPRPRKGAARRCSESASSSSFGGTGAGVQAGGIGGGASGAKSNSGPRSATAATPSAITWCKRMSKRHPPIRQASQQPELPQRSRSIERRLVELGGLPEKSTLVTRRGNGLGPDVASDIEVTGVDPHRRSESGARLMEHLSEPGHQVQATFHMSPDVLQPQPAGRRRGAARREQGKPGGVHRRPAVLRS